MSISVRDRKILWVKSGNQCAFPGCQQVLVTSARDGQTDAVLGDEAHIVSASPGGPRGHEGIPNSGPDSYENIILLCPTHHRFVDSAPDMFTRDTLVDMKRLHEGQIRSAISLSTDPVEQFLPRDTWCGQNMVGSWRVGRSIAVVFSYGSPPIRLHNGHWRGSGICFGQQNVESMPDIHCLFDSSEAQPDIEYWVSGSTLNVVQEALLYDQGHFVPFVRHEFNLTSMPAEERRFVLLEPDSTAGSRIPELVNDIESFERDAPLEDLYAPLFQLWQAGFSDPVRVREILRGFRRYWWCDGEVGETISSMGEELTLVETSARAGG